jgi:hypothetical protein
LTRLLPLIAEYITRQRENELPGEGAGEDNREEPASDGANQAGDDSTEPTGDLRVAAVCSELEIAEWFDVDTVVENYCSKENIPIPTDLDAQVELHIRAMEEWAQSIQKSAPVT